MKPETKARIEETVREILEKSDMSETTEYQIRKQASNKLGLDLSQSEYKAFVRHVVNSFLEEQEEKSKQQEDQEENDQVEEAEEEVNVDGEYDDEGNLIVCKLSDKRRVTIQDFRGKTLISIREYYRKDGKELPSSKGVHASRLVFVCACFKRFVVVSSGISLTEEQWSVLKTNVSAIEKAVQKMESQIMRRFFITANCQVAACPAKHGNPLVLLMNEQIFPTLLMPLVSH
ncbi:hypothetical protein JRO89_XS13G0136200 [Xanthoceras sorbifolium]|uniref:DEK-C domain-containing protein n=1 Tax=Xanthoceras sorbifolium TaxID=99658 RepID=A0ABQ8H862_9ROSI|nr:hypothetical protein JRO89_XS13G0136200 [Xanthoceras sorbifolium]